MAILQPGDDQTFYLKSYPSGQQYECYLTAHEILELAKKTDPTFDSIALGAYAYDYFGYWIFPFTLGSQNVVNFRDSGLSGPTDGDYIAVDKDVSSYSTTYIINEDGTALDGSRLGTNGWSYQYNYDLGSPYWFRVVNFGVLPVIYTESNYNQLFLNGEEYKPGNATIRVNYYLPDDNYEYARITYKKNDKPESVNDGTIVPISPNDSYIDIPKFVEGQSYWFKIFTNKSESEAFGYTVGRIWDGSEIAILWSGNSNKLTAKINNNHIIFTFYSSNTVIYTFNSFVGTEVADIDKINIGFLISNEQHLAKPSFIYNNGTYSYNQEEPTDEQMGFIYTWLSTGL